MGRFITTIDGRTVVPASTNTGYKMPVPTWDHGTATVTVTKASAAAAVKRAAQLKAASKPKPTKATVKRPAHIAPKPAPKPVAKAAPKPAPKPVAAPKPAPTPTVKAPVVATPSASTAGLPLGMIALVAGGLFIVVVLLSRRKRR